ncbi:MAG: thioredoxin family protein [Alistipes sp.]|nr:thioredoxin family protein [Alistipes sp.]
MVLTLALMLPFAAFAEGDKTVGEVNYENEGSPVEWVITAEKESDGLFVVTFDGAIKEGFHGYPMTDFSAPYFEFDNATAVGEMTEPLTPVEHGIDELTGEPSKIYYDRALYVQKIEAKDGQKVTGFVQATICTNDTNQCTSNAATFAIVMPGVAAVEASEPAAEGGNLDWSSIIQAILWGFAALLTPCVFPMVPMTVSFFVKGSQSPAQGRFRAFMYGFFIVALYVLPIAVLVLLSNAFGTNVAGDIFNAIGTHWIPNLIFFVIFMVFAASFLGAFEITLPSSLVNKSDAGADKGGLIGIFFMALTLVLVSFSCTGPIVGSVIISSTSGGVWMPIITMFAFALAFALPFTVLAWFPSLLKNLPKSGGWLNSVKVVLGFIEVALGLKFLMTADQTMHWGLLDRETYLAIWIVVFSLLGFYLLGKLRFAHDDKVEHVSVFRLSLAIAVFSFVVYMIPGMWGAPLNAISGYIPPMSTQDYQVNGRVENANAGRKYADFLHLPHQLEGHFDFEEAVADAQKQNKPIFVDVTGHACNNCREMETMVWSNDRVLPMLRDDFVICALYVDDMTKIEGGKRLGSVNAAFAQERWGVNAQPGYILLAPDGETVLAGPRGYDTDIDAFVKFLEKGKNF